MATYKSQIQSLIGGGWIDGSIESTSAITPNLTAKEIANPSCREDIKLKLYGDSLRALAAWQFVRDQYGKAIPVTSGYRSASYNKEMGGADDSLHLKCCAFDCRLNMTEALYKKFYTWVYAAAAKFDTQAELGRYSWGLHIGFGALSYTDKIVYEFDKRGKA